MSRKLHGSSQEYCEKADRVIAEALKWRKSRHLAGSLPDSQALIRAIDAFTALNAAERAK